MASPANLERSPEEAAPASRRWCWLLVAALLLLEYGLFRQYAEREVVWGYPTGWDQACYLGPSYETYEQILQSGLWPGLRFAFHYPTAKGPMMHTQAALLFLVLGPSRLSALTLNFLYFAVLQCALVGTVRWYSGRWGAALFALGLLLSAHAPFYSFGGLMDFRIDFIACCLFGTFLCVVLRSGLFASWKWSAAAGVVATLLVLFRSLTALYLAGILGTLGLALCVSLYRHRHNKEAQRAWKQRLRGLLLAVAILTVLAAPSVWGNRFSIRAYYLGHLASDEARERNLEFGVHGLKDRLLYYPRSILKDHAGQDFLALAGLALMSGLVVGRFRTALERSGPRYGGLPAGGAAGFTALGLLVPLTTLTLYGSPSPVVGNIAMPALVLLTVLIAVAWAGIRRGSPGGRLQTSWAAALAMMGLLVGSASFADALSRRGPLSPQRDEVEGVLQAYDAIARYSRDSGWASPILACNDFHDAFNVLAIRATLYERQHRVVCIRQSLPAGICAATEASALAALECSDFALITLGPAPEELTSSTALYVYPFVKSMAQCRPQMLAECERDFVPLQRFSLSGNDVILFARPVVRMSGITADGWITSHGLTLTSRAADLRRFPRIQLRGEDTFSYLGKAPGVHAELQSSGGSGQTVPASLVVEGKAYVITVDIDPEDLADESDVNIRLTFDTSFRPLELLPGSRDPRELVMRAPSWTNLVARSSTGRSGDPRR